MRTAEKGDAKGPLGGLRQGGLGWDVVCAVQLDMASIVLLDEVPLGLSSKAARPFVENAVLVNLSLVGGDVENL